MTETRSVAAPSTSDRLGPEVRRLLRERLPSHWAGDPLDDALRLDESGLGFDSVALVELVVACEKRFSVRLPSAILRREAPTVAELVEWLRDAGA